MRARQRRCRWSLAISGTESTSAEEKNAVFFAGYKTPGRRPRPHLSRTNCARSRCEKVFEDILAIHRGERLFANFAAHQPFGRLGYAAKNVMNTITITQLADFAKLVVRYWRISQSKLNPARDRSVWRAELIGRIC